MTEKQRVFVSLLICLLFMIGFISAQEDAEGGKDHPLFTRMPGFYIDNYNEKEFDYQTFWDEEDNDYTVEGHSYVIDYILKDDAKAPSALQIIKNHTNAITQIGGDVLYMNPDAGAAHMSVKKNGGEIWVKIECSTDGDYYTMVIVEKGTMAQEVVADPEALANSIHQTGHVAVYGIYFDSGSTELKPESEEAMQQIAALLKSVRYKPS